MAKQKINRYSFADIFHYAEKKFDISWNKCCDIFHSSEIFTYNSFDEFTIDEINENLEYVSTKKDYNEKENGYFILKSFMEFEGIKDIFIDGR